MHSAIDISLRQTVNLHDAHHQFGLVFAFSSKPVVLLAVPPEGPTLLRNMAHRAYMNRIL